MCLTLSVNFPLLLLYSFKICCSRLAFYIQIAIKPLDVSLLFVLLAQHRLLWAIANAKIINLPVHSVISAQTLSFGPLARRLFNGNDTAVRLCNSLPTNRHVISHRTLSSVAGAIDRLSAPGELTPATTTFTDIW